MKVSSSDYIQYAGCRNEALSVGLANHFYLHDSYEEAQEFASELHVYPSLQQYDFSPGKGVSVISREHTSSLEIEWVLGTWRDTIQLMADAM